MFKSLITISPYYRERKGVREQDPRVDHLFEKARKTLDNCLDIRLIPRKETPPVVRYQHLSQSSGSFPARKHASSHKTILVRWTPSYPSRWFLSFLPSTCTRWIKVTIQDRREDAINILFRAVDVVIAFETRLTRDRSSRWSRSEEITPNFDWGNGRFVG